METLPAGHRTLKSVHQSLRERAGLDVAMQYILDLQRADAEEEALQNSFKDEVTLKKEADDRLLSALRAMRNGAETPSPAPGPYEDHITGLAHDEDAVREWLRLLLEAGSVAALVETVEGQPARQIPDYEWADVVTGDNNISWGSFQDGSDRKTILFTDEAADEIIAIYDREHERPFWSQMMMLAWVFHRDQNLLNRVQRAEEIGSEALSFLRLATVTTTDEEDFSDVFDKTGAELNSDAAIRQGPTLMKLLNHLMAGEITATGRRNDEGERGAILPDVYSDYTLYVSSPPVLAPQDRRRSELPVWCDLQFRAHEVRQHYPARDHRPAVVVEPGREGARSDNVIALRKPKPLQGFGGLEYFTLKRLAEAWTETQDIAPTLSFEEIYKTLFDALWDGVFDGVLVQINYETEDPSGAPLTEPVEVGLQQYRGEESRYNEGDFRLRFQFIIRDRFGLDRHAKLTAEHFKTVSPRLLVSPDIPLFRHDNIGIRAQDFIERWTGAGYGLPSCLGGHPRSPTNNAGAVEAPSQSRAEAADNDTSPQAYTRQRLETWLRALMGSGDPTKNRDDYRDDAQQQFEGLSGKEFKNRWSDIAAEYPGSKWGRSGRRPLPKS